MQVQCGVKWVGNEAPLECFWFTMWHTCIFIRFIIVEICNIHSPDTSLLYTYIQRYALHSPAMFFGAYFKSSELRHAVFKSSIKENICSGKEQTNADCRYSGFKNLIFKFSVSTLAGCISSGKCRELGHWLISQAPAEQLPSKGLLMYGLNITAHIN